MNKIISGICLGLSFTAAFFAFWLSPLWLVVILSLIFIGLLLVKP